jgi:hypothetical protein
VLLRVVCTECVKQPHHVRDVLPIRPPVRPFRPFACFSFETIQLVEFDTCVNIFVLLIIIGSDPSLPPQVYMKLKSIFTIFPKPHIFKQILVTYISCRHGVLKGVWGSRCIVLLFLTSALVGCEWSASRTGRFTPGERVAGTHWIEGWVGPRAGLGDTENILDPIGTRTPISWSSSP